MDPSLSLNTSAKIYEKMFSFVKGMEATEAMPIAEVVHTCTTAIKKHSVRRMYKAGTWDDLAKIVCNKCQVEKDKTEYSAYRYTCKLCVGTPVKAKLERTEPNKHRLYKNGAWATLEKITCSTCNEEKQKADFKLNRYICIPCSKAHMRELNKKKEGGKYDELQREYNARYEATPHGMQRRQEYREKQKEHRATVSTRKVNPLNRMRIGMRHKIHEVLNTQIHNPVHLMKVSAAMQYLGVTENIMKNWVGFNLEEGMTWDNMGTVWKLELVQTPGSVITTEKDKFEAFNWRNWSPTRIGSEPRVLRDRSIAFLAKN